MRIISINKRYTKNQDNIACNMDSAVLDDVIAKLYKNISSYLSEFEKYFRLSLVENEETILQIERLLKDNEVEINPFIIDKINKGLSDIASERKKMLEEIAEKTGLPLEKSEE